MSDNRARTPDALAEGMIVPERTDPAFFAQHLAAYDFARRFAQERRVLEIGFGDGYGANYLAQVAREVKAVDVSPANVQRAAAKYPRPNLQFRATDGLSLPFPDGSFDLVGAFQVIEHIPEAKLVAFLREIARVLAPGGLVCLSTLNLEHNQKAGRPYEKLHVHEKEFTAPELEALLKQVFPAVDLYGLYPSLAHRLAQRLKKWGLMR